MFPTFLNLRSRRVVVVGAGPVAASKLDALLTAGADITVIAPEVRPEVLELPVRVIRKRFEASDLDGAWWVVAAAPGEINKQVLTAADERRIFVNAVDDPAHATAYLGGVVRRDDVTVAISTNGRAPALAGLLREALDAWLPRDLDEWLAAADEARRRWKAQCVPMEARRPQLLETLNKLYEGRFASTPESRIPSAEPPVPNPESGTPNPARVALVGAGPGDPALWTVRAVRLLEDADLVLYDALVNVDALRRTTRAQCFCVGKRARRDSVPQDTINRLMIRAARQGKRVVRLKGGDPFVFGRGGEEMLSLAIAGIACEVVPGVTTAVAAPELAGIPLTHRGIASGFLVLAGHTTESVDNALEAVRPNSLSIVMLMSIGARADLASRLIAHGWPAEAPAAIVCAASTPDAWTWTGPLAQLGAADPPEGLAGVLVVGEVVCLRDVICQSMSVNPPGEPGDEVSYGRNG